MATLPLLASEKLPREGWHLSRPRGGRFGSSCLRANRVPDPFAIAFDKRRYMTLVNCYLNGTLPPLRDWLITRAVMLLNTWFWKGNPFP
jgi:hypothetical protein